MPCSVRSIVKDVSEEGVKVLVHLIDKRLSTLSGDLCNDFIQMRRESSGWVAGLQAPGASNYSVKRIVLL